jgi:hypothetical protein
MERSLSGPLDPRGRDDAQPHLARVNADGTLDSAFDANLHGYVFGNPNFPPQGYVVSTALQANGMNVIGGIFTVERWNGAH